MKNRIRKSVKMIRQCDSSVKDNLSDLDYKIYSMVSSSGSVTLGELLNDGHYGDYAGDQDQLNSDNIGDYVLEDNREIRQQNFDNYGVATEEQSHDNDNDFVGGLSLNLSEFRDGGLAPRVLVVQSSEELEAYANASIIVDEEESMHEIDDVIYASTSRGYEWL